MSGDTGDLSPNTFPLRIADLIEQRLQKPSAMDDSNNEDFVVLDAVDNPIAVDEEFTDLIIIKLWPDASGIRKCLELARRIEDLVDYCPCVGWRITG